MGSFSWAHWLIVGIVVLVFFGGRGKISDVMGDFAKGIKAFKSGMKEEDEPGTASTTTPPAAQVTPPPVATAAAPTAAVADRPREHA